jgi:glycosyltransferase involved in cell wall biosynthesis
MKKVLFISYYWPPSGKASLQWPLKIIKHLPAFGWIPSVLTVDKDSFTQKDATFLNEIPDKVKVIKARSFEPFDIYKKILGKKKEDQLIASETISKQNTSFAHQLSVWLRMNVFIPDARVGWYFPAVKAGTNFLSDEKIDAVVSIGPPHTTHLVGKKFAANSGIPHVPVFIDPWVDISYYKEYKRSQLTLTIDKRLEKSVLENASAIIYVTETMKNDYIKKYPRIENKSNVLYWGYSEEDFSSLSPSLSLKDKKDEEIILHAGNIFDHQNPKEFWKTINKEISIGRKLKLVFIGTVSPGIKQSITNSGLDTFTEYKGFLPYKQMLNEMLNANYLLVCASEPRHVPGKLFEYLRAGKPIIAFGDGNDEVKKIITEANAGMMFSYNESAEEFFGKSQSFKTEIDIIRKFERTEIAKSFSEILKHL